MKKNLTKGFKLFFAAFTMMTLPMSSYSQSGIKPVITTDYAVTRPSVIVNGGRSAMTSIINDVKENEQWWGYFDGDYEGNIGLLGLEAPGVYNCCVKISSASEMGKGKTIEGLKFSFPSLEDIEDIYIWISETLPDNAEKADITWQKLDKNTLSDLNSTDALFNEVRFEKPFMIGENDVYVGYSFNVVKAETQEAKQPMLISKWPETTDKNALFFNVPGEEWTDCATYPFGNLAVQMLMSKKDTKNAVSIQRHFDSEIAGKMGSVVQVTLNLTNEGSDGCSEFKYVIKDGKQTYPEETVILDNKITKIDESFKYTFNIPVSEETGRDTVMISITGVNGVDNESVGFTTSGGNIYSLSKVADHKVFIEHFVGVWDGHSPRAYVAMDRMTETYGDNAIIASVHAGNVEAMECADYKELTYYYKGTTGFPAAFVDRTINNVDPYWGEEILSDFGFEECFLKVYNTVALAEIKVNAYFDESGENIVADTETDFLCNTENVDYAVGYVLKEDGMSGEGEAWDQINQFVDFKDTGFFDADPRFDWWMNADPTIKGYVFNNVAIAAQGMTKKGIEGSLQAPYVENAPQKHSVTFALADYPVIQDKNNLTMCAVVFNRNNGRIVNSCASKVNVVNAINDANNDNNVVEIERYSADGRQIKVPVKGLNIIKYSDGSVKKVIVR